MRGTAVSGVWHQIGEGAAQFTNILTTVDAESATQCGGSCLNWQGCRGFDFSKEEKECVLHDGAITAPVNQSINRGGQMYQNFGNSKKYNARSEDGFTKCNHDVSSKKTSLIPFSAKVTLHVSKHSKNAVFLEASWKKEGVAVQGSQDSDIKIYI